MLQKKFAKMILTLRYNGLCPVLPSIDLSITSGVAFTETLNNTRISDYNSIMFLGLFIPYLC